MVVLRDFPKKKQCIVWVGNIMTTVNITHCCYVNISPREAGHQELDLSQLTLGGAPFGFDGKSQQQW